MQKYQIFHTTYQILSLASGSSDVFCAQCAVTTDVVRRSTQVHRTCPLNSSTRPTHPASPPTITRPSGPCLPKRPAPNPPPRPGQLRVQPFQLVHLEVGSNQFFSSASFPSNADRVLIKSSGDFTLVSIRMAGRTSCLQ